MGAVSVVLMGLGFAEQANTVVTRFEPWQLQALGATLFVIAVVRVLVRYDKEHSQRRAVGAPLAKPPTVAVAPPQNTFVAPTSWVEGKPDPSILPPNIVDEYIALILSDPTELQQRRMMQPYDGKWIVLELTLLSTHQQDGELQTLMRYQNDGGVSEMVWVHFDMAWEDYIHGVKKGGKIRFKGKVHVGKRGNPRFVEAVPL